MNSIPRSRNRVGACVKVAFDAPDFPRCRATGVVPRFVGEYRQQPSIAWVEVEMVLVGLAEVRLLEDERHSQHAFPEIDRALLGRTDEGDVVKPLHLDLFHVCLRSGTR